MTAAGSPLELDPIEVVAFRCSLCSELYADRDEAAGCCVCRVCRAAPVADPEAYDRRCEACDLRWHAARIRGDVKHAKRVLGEKEAMLAEVEAEQAALVATGKAPPRKRTPKVSDTYAAKQQELDLAARSREPLDHSGREQKTPVPNAPLSQESMPRNGAESLGAKGEGRTPTGFTPLEPEGNAARRKRAVPRSSKAPKGANQG